MSLHSTKLAEFQVDAMPPSQGPNLSLDESKVADDRPVPTLSARMTAPATSITGPSSLVLLNATSQPRFSAAICTDVAVLYGLKRHAKIYPAWTRKTMFEKPTMFMAYAAVPATNVNGLPEMKASDRGREGTGEEVMLPSMVLPVSSNIVGQLNSSSSNFHPFAVCTR